MKFFIERLIINDTPKALYLVCRLKNGREISFESQKEVSASIASGIFFAAHHPRCAEVYRQALQMMEAGQTGPVIVETANK